MRAKDVMTADPATVDDQKTVREAIEILLALGARHLPVTSDGQLLGIVSDRDVRQLIVPVSWNQSAVREESENASLLDEPVTAVMSGGTIAVSPDASIGEVIDLICDHGIGALPVTDTNGAVVGIVSYVDVLRALRPAE